MQQGATISASVVTAPPNSYPSGNEVCSRFRVVPGAEVGRSHSARCRYLRPSGSTNVLQASLRSASLILVSLRSRSSSWAQNEYLVAASVRRRLCSSRSAACLK